MVLKYLSTAKKGGETQKRSSDDLAVHLRVCGFFTMEKVTADTIDRLDKVRPIARNRLTPGEVELGARRLKLSQALAKVTTDAFFPWHRLVKV